jgi:hypothetical protein
MWWGSSAGPTRCPARTARSASGTCVPNYYAAKALAAADPSWLEQLITRRVGPAEAQQALQRAPDDIKVVMEFARAEP